MRPWYSALLYTLIKISVPIQFIVFPYVMTRRWDLLDPERISDFWQMICILTPLNIMCIWCHTVTAYLNPGIIEPSDFLPLKKEFKDHCNLIQN